MENKSARMGTLPIRSLLLKISLPIMFSMLIQALYNVVDTYYVAQISEAAMTAVSYAFPIQMLMIAVGVGTGVGINSLISRRLGEHKQEEALLTAENGVFLALLAWIVFAAFGFIGARWFIGLFTADTNIIAMSVDYLQICCIFSFGVFMQLAFEKIMQGSGNTIYNMITQSTGAIINIILDPIMIFGYGPFPQMGVAGAAWATVIGQVAAAVLAFILNQRFNKELRLRIKGFKPSWKIIKGIYIVGLPSIVMQSVGSFMMAFLNVILGAFSLTAVAFMGIYSKIQSFIFMPVFGLTNGAIAVIGYNYGAKNKKRVYQAIKVAITYALIIMLIGTFLFMVFPEPILKIFNASSDMLLIGKPALRIISISYIFAAVGIVLSTVFQAVGNGVLSLIVSMVRQIVVLLPMAFILSKTVGLAGVWWAFPISEMVAFIFSLFFFKKANEKYIKPLSE